MLRYTALIAQDEIRFKNVVLRVNMVPILVQIPDCQQITEVCNCRFVCTCGKPCGNVVQGNELLIERVEMSDE